MQRIRSRNDLTNAAQRLRREQRAVRDQAETAVLSAQLRAGQITIEQLTSAQRIAVQSLWMQEYLLRLITRSVR